MELTSVKTIKSIMSSYGFKFSKSLGQNFLINPKVCPRMSDIAIDCDNMGVIEIGTGIGTLTVELAKKAKKVLTFEVDNNLYDIHKQTLSEFDNIEVIHNDIMKSNLKEMSLLYFGDMEVAVCANLPYYITTPIIMYLLESKVQFKNITVMIQKEAADRITAEIGTKNAGAITFAVRYYGIAEECFCVNSSDFMPPPKVNSAVIKITPDSYVKDRILQKEAYFKIVKAGFSQRRKSIVNSLYSGLGIDKNDIISLLSSLGIKENIRMEQLNIDDIINLSNLYYNKYIEKQF